MKKFKLVNVSELSATGLRDYFPPFSIENYEFHSQEVQDRSMTAVHTTATMVRSNRLNKQNAFVQFSGRQENSIIFKGGMIGTAQRPTHRRKIIEDILLLGSLLGGNNWEFYSRRHSGGYPVTARNNLTRISKDSIEIQSDISALLTTLRDPTWQQRFDNGFHLIMLKNAANLNNTESRFLSMMVIWEFLFSKLFNDESENLHEIMKKVLEHFWGAQVNGSIFMNGRDHGISKNIFYVLRNQLAHSGRLPINRDYAETWMTQMPWEEPLRNGGGTKKYLSFFDELTHVIVLKTLNFHPESRDFFSLFGFNPNLTKFLSTGRLS